MTYIHEINEWVCRWGCVDLDVKSPGHKRWDFDTTEEALIAAKDLGDTLRHFGIRPWTEITRSGGVHVWVFAQQSTLCRTMRRALIVACKIAHVPITEVNPKSEGFDDPTTLGNYVNLPYPGGELLSDRRSMILKGGGPMPAEQFIDLAWHTRADIVALESLAQLYVEPPPERSITWEPTTDDDEFIEGLPAYFRTIILEGPEDPDHDRSGWLYYIACRCLSEGVEDDVACDILRIADERWTQKFTNRKDAEKMYERTVMKAFQ
jgi:hypothetical protein